MIREEPGPAGVIVLRDVPVGPAPPGQEGTILHFRGVERGPGGFTVRAFLGGTGSGKTVDPGHAELLGELPIYATTSPTVLSAGDVPASRSLPPPRALAPYDTFLDVSAFGPRLAAGPARLDITLILVDTPSRPVRADHFQFADLSIESNQITNR